MGAIVQGCAEVEENQDRELTRVTCHQKVICDFHKGCLSAMMGAKARLKLFKKVVVRQIGV